MPRPQEAREGTVSVLSTISKENQGICRVIHLIPERAFKEGLGSGRRCTFFFPRGEPGAWLHGEGCRGVTEARQITGRSELERNAEQVQTFLQARSCLASHRCQKSSVNAKLRALNNSRKWAPSSALRSSVSPPWLHTIILGSLRGPRPALFCWRAVGGVPTGNLNIYIYNFFFVCRGTNLY